MYDKQDRSTNALFCSDHFPVYMFLLLIRLKSNEKRNEYRNEYRNEKRNENRNKTEMKREMKTEDSS